MRRREMERVNVTEHRVNARVQDIFFTLSSISHYILIIVIIHSYHSFQMRNGDLTAFIVEPGCEFECA